MALLFETVDVDELRAELMATTCDALELADDIVSALDTDRVADAHAVAANYWQLRTRMRQLRSAIRIEEGNA